MNKIKVKNDTDINWNTSIKEDFPISTASHAYHSDWQNTKVEGICGGTNCKLASSCSRHCKSEGIYTYCDFSTTGSGGSNCKETWDCGDMSHNYPLYELKGSKYPTAPFPSPCKVGDRVKDWIVSEIATRVYLDDDRTVKSEVLIELIDVDNTSNIYCSRTYTMEEFVNEFGVIK